MSEDQEALRYTKAGLSSLDGWPMDYVNRIRLRTPESVELEFALAGIGSRAQALLIDYLVLGIGLFLFLVAWGYFSVSALDVLNQLGFDEDTIGNWLVAVGLLIYFFVYVGYFVFFEVFWQGQTPGKRYCQIQVIRDDGRRVGLQQSSLRSLIRPIDDIFFLGAILIALTPREKRLGDWLAGTLVVQLGRIETDVSFLVTDAARQLAQDLPDQSTVDQLHPDDFAVIRELLRRRSMMEPQARQQVTVNLAHQVADRIHFTIRAGITSEMFLEAVYLAYRNDRNNRSQSLLEHDSAL